MKFLFNIVVICFILFLLFNYSSFFYQSPRYIKLAHKITANTGKELKAKKNLYLVGTGGQMMNDIQMMAMSFDYYQEVDLKEARKLIVYVVNEYLSAINSSKEIRPYLHEYPFTAKNIEIRIFIYEPNGSDVPPDKINIATANQGKVTYYINRPEQYTLEFICKETFEEALQAISSE